MVIVACPVLRCEIEKALEDLGEPARVLYLPWELHYNGKGMESVLREKLAEAAQDGEQVGLVLGTGCLPDIDAVTSDYGASYIPAKNCIHMLLGDEMFRLIEEKSTFFLTKGWIDSWRAACAQGIAWDPVDARVNYGVFERTLYLDSGTENASDEELFEYYEYTQCPIEPYAITLEKFKSLLSDFLLSRESCFCK